MSKLEVKEIGPISGETDLTLGQSGGTVTLADGATAVGFGSEAPEYPIGQVRAWVNFDGTGTVAIRESINVSSITDIAVGVYRVNFATAMPDSDYAFFGSAKVADTTQFGRIATPSGTYSTTSCELRCTYAHATPATGPDVYNEDQLHVSVAIIR